MKTPHPPVLFERFIEGDAYAESINALFLRALKAESRHEITFPLEPCTPQRFITTEYPPDPEPVVKLGPRRSVDFEARETARKEKRARYKSNYACKDHGFVWRYVSSMNCVICQKEKNLKFRNAPHGEKGQKMSDMQEGDLVRRRR